MLSLIVAAGSTLGLGVPDRGPRTADRVSRMIARRGLRLYFASFPLRETAMKKACSSTLLLALCLAVTTLTGAGAPPR